MIPSEILCQCIEIAGQSEFYDHDNTKFKLTQYILNENLVGLQHLFFGSSFHN